MCVSGKFSPVLSFQGTTSIALHPPTGRLCYTTLVLSGGKNQAEVDCAWMDGRNKAVLWRKWSLPTSLVFSVSGTVIYWADIGEELKTFVYSMSSVGSLSDCRFPAGDGVIGSIGVDGSGYKQHKTGPGLLISFTHVENLLLWVTLDKGKNEDTKRPLSTSTSSMSSVVNAATL